MIYTELEQDIINRAGKELSSEIDFHVLADLYSQDGWTEVNLPRQPRETVVEILSWCASHNIKCYGRGQRWVFEKKQDALFFSLRWA